jgi:hypothetical protein
VGGWGGGGARYAPPPARLQGEACGCMCRTCSTHRPPRPHRRYAVCLGLQSCKSLARGPASAVRTRDPFLSRTFTQSLLCESRYQRSGAHIWSIRKHARAPRTLALILQATFRSLQPPLLARLYRWPSVSSRRLERGLAGGPFTVPARQRTAGASAGGRACGRVEVGRSVAETAKRGGGEEGGGAGLRTMARQMGW